MNDNKPERILTSIECIGWLKDPKVRTAIRSPVLDNASNRLLVSQDICPQCRGELDTGWECTTCQYDARWLAEVAG